MSDLFTGLQMFQNGMRDIGVMRALGSANEQVQQIKASGMEEFQQRSAIQELSNGLTARLAGIGADPARAQLIGAAMGPAKPTTAETANEVLLNPNLFSPGQRGTAKGMRDEEMGFKRDEAALSKLKIMAELLNKETTRVDKNKEQLNKEIDIFASAPDVKPIWDMASVAGRMEARLKAGDNLGYQTALTDFLKSAEGGGKLSDDDVRRAKIDPSIAGEVQNYLSLKMSGKPAEANQKVLIASGKVIGQYARRILGSKAGDISKAKELKGYTAEEFEKKLRQRAGLHDEEEVTSGGGQSSGPMDLRKYRFQP